MQEALEKIGLTPTEAKIYLALLKIGEAKTGEILKEAKLNSGRIYQVLGSLEKKGLVSSIKKKKVKLFIPSPPERILDYLQEKEKEVIDKKNMFKNNLPALLKNFNQLKVDTSVEVFFGSQGQKTAYSILFKQSSNDKNLYVYGISSKEKYSQEILNILNYYVYKKRKELNLKVKKLAAEETRKQEFFKQDKSEIKYLPYPSMTSIQILGNITMISFEQDTIITILIHNKNISDDYKKQFEFLWKIAKH